MNFSDSLFEQYFSNALDEEIFIKKLGILNSNFICNLKLELEIAVVNKDAQRLEYLIYALMLWYQKTDKSTQMQLSQFLGLLNVLLISDWHYQHENIVMLLQIIASNESVKYLYEAALMNYQYLSWDDNYAFETRCIRALFHIGGNESIYYLKILSKSENDVIKEAACKQLKKIALD